MAKPIKMLKPGKYIDKNRVTVEFTAADLAATAAAYDPSVGKCPLTIGHPDDDSAPAYGSLDKVSFAAPFLCGDPAPVDAKFADIVNKGYYDHVSLSLFSPTHQANPVPGVWYPRHLAFLGAAAPAVPGLGTVSLAADDGCVEFALGRDGIVSLGSYEDTLVARLLRGLKNALIGELGQEKADAALPEWDLQCLTEEAARPEPETQKTPVYLAAPTKESHMTAEELAAKTAELDQRERDLLARERTRIHGDHVAFAAQLTGKENMRFLPAHKEAIVGVLDQLAGVATAATVSFSSGAEEKTLTPLDALKAIMTAQPKIVSFSEEAPSGNVKEGKTKTRLKFAELSASDQSAFVADGGTITD